MATQRAAARQSGLRLKAEDADDLAVIAACLQDAVVVQSDLVYLPRERRFVLMANRYCWEAEPPGGGGLRVRSGVHFDGVLKVAATGLDRARRDRVLELLTIIHQPGEDGTGQLFLLFCGGAAVRLEVECIDCHLADIGEPWATVRRPRHAVGRRDDEER